MTQPYHNEFCDLQNTFKQSSHEVKHLLDSLSEEYINKKLAPGKWSVAECIRHLILTGKYVTIEIDKSITNGIKRNKMGNPPFKYGWFNRYFIRYMKHKSHFTMAAPKLYKPDLHSYYDKSVLVTSYLDLQEQYCRLLEKADGLDLKRVKVRSPVIPVMRLSLGACFHAMAAHQERHIDQAKRTNRNLWSK